MSNACLVELVVVCLDRRVHAINPVTVIEHLPPHVRRVLFAVGSLHVRRVVVGLPVLAGLVLVVVSVPNGVVSCFGGPLAVRRVFWQFALRELVFDGVTIVARRQFLLVQQEGSIGTKGVPFSLPVGQGNPQRIAHGAHHLLQGGVDPQIVIARLTLV